MEIDVVCFGVLKEHLPDDREGNRARLDLGPGATMKDVAGALRIPEDQVFALLVNGERADLSQGLQEGDEVTLMPPFSGGRRPQG